MLFTSRLRDNTLNSSPHLQELDSPSARTLFETMEIFLLLHFSARAWSGYKYGNVIPRQPDIYNRITSTHRQKDIWKLLLLTPWWLHLLSIRFYLTFPKKNLSQNVRIQCFARYNWPFSVLKYTMYQRKWIHLHRMWRDLWTIQVHKVRLQKQVFDASHIKWRIASKV